MLPPQVREIAKELLTAKELDAVELSTSGVGYKRLAILYGVSISTARDRVQRGMMKLGRDPRVAEYLERCS